MDRPSLSTHARALALGLVSLGLANCSSKTSSNGTGRTAGSGGAVGGGGTSGASTNPASAGSFSLIGVGMDDGGLAGSPSCVTCSADLHDVVDCSGNLLMSCPSDKGCAAGACVPACDAAKANASAQGCEFYSAVPAPEAGTHGACFAALLTNTWTAPVTIQAEYDGMPLDVATITRTPKGTGAGLTYEPLAGGQLTPGQVGILFLARAKPDAANTDSVDCPSGIQPGVTVETSIAGTGTGKAFHITTSAPVAAFDMYPYGGARSHVSSATLLVPTSAWGKNYMGVDAWNSGDANDPDAREPVDTPYPSYPSLQIVAQEDATNVTMSPTVPIVGGKRNPNLASSRDVAATPAGQPVTYTLSKGDVLQFLQFDELTGSAIGSDKPIGVWGGHSCMMIPFGNSFCDSAHQQLLPISWLGSEYVAVRYRDRLSGHPETVPWTLVGVVDGTMLTYDPSPPPSAPTSLSRGQAVHFDAPDAFSVRSQDDAHPFYVAGHMTGGSNASVSADSGMGDPEFVNVVPPQQWLPSYVFLTDPTYATTHLVFVRQKGKDMTFKDVSLDCAGTLKDWMPVGSSGQFEFTRFDFDKKEGGCTDGAHVAKSDGNFGLTVWGWDAWVSYAYPAGLSTRPVNTVVVKPDPIVK